MVLEYDFDGIKVCHEIDEYDIAEVICNVYKKDLLGNMRGAKLGIAKLLEDLTYTPAFEEIFEYFEEDIKDYFSNDAWNAYEESGLDSGDPYEGQHI